MQLLQDPLFLIDDDATQLIEALPAAVYTCDSKGRITYFNEAAAQLWGRRPELGKDLWCGSWKIYSTKGNPLPLDECPMAIALKEGRAITGHEIIVERQDGTRLNILPYPRPLFDSYNRIKGAVNMLIDITEKKEHENELLQSESRYRRLAESLEDKFQEKTKNLIKSEERYHKMVEEVQEYAILLLDKDGIILNWNKGAEKIKGYTEQEIVGKNFRIFYLDEDRLSGLPEKLINEAMVHGKAMHEGWRKKKNGEKFWGSIVITALHDWKNNVIGFSKVTRDLTEKKKIDDQLKQHARQLEFQNQEMEQFVFVASHDLQEPLRKVRTYARMLEKNLTNKEEAKLYLEKINSSASRMSALIKDVLTYSQLLKTEDFFTQVDLNTVLEYVLDDYELLIKEKEAVIKFSPLPIVKGNPVQLRQLFANLISNALKFSGVNPIINITSKELVNDKVQQYAFLNQYTEYFKLDFKDNGAGFDPQFAKHVFKLFQRLNDGKPGNGIGLAICKKVVENHHGHITVDSEPNKGTTFSVFLPVS